MSVRTSSHRSKSTEYEDYELEEGEENPEQEYDEPEYDPTQNELCYVFDREGVKKHSSHTEKNKMNIKKYIEFLYNYLGAKLCFTSGAFVIGDAHARLYAFLLKGVSYDLTDHHKDKTHIRLKLRSRRELKEGEYGIDNNMYENWMCTNNKCCKNKEDKLTFIMKCKCPDEDKYSSRPARNVKWYQFLGTDFKKYIYIKLENWPTPHSEHTKEAILRYGLGISNKSCVKSRREDCGKNCAIKKNPDKIKDYQFDAFTINGGHPVPIIEEYGRIGDEMFVPNKINDFILINIENNTDAAIKIRHDAHANIQHITTVEEGAIGEGAIGEGGRKTKRLKKNKKRARRTRKIKGKRIAFKTRRKNRT